MTLPPNCSFFVTDIHGTNIHPGILRFKIYFSHRKDIGKSSRDPINKRDLSLSLFRDNRTIFGDSRCENRGGGGANNGPGNLYSSQRHPVPTAASRVAYHACIRVIFGSWPVASLVTKLWRRFVPRRLTLDNRGTNSLIHSPSCVHDSIISPRMICELNGNRTVYVVYFSFFFFFFCDSSSSENMMDVFL